VFRASHALRNKSRVIGALALASAIVLLSFGTAQAQTATTTTLTSSPNPSVAGQPVTVTAAISGSGGTPSGTVTFFADGNSIGTGTLGSSGQATVTIATLAVGSHTITTTYPGDSNFNGSNGGPLTQTVNKNDTTTLVLSSINPSEFGQSVTFTAAISPVTGTGGALVPSGTVNFFDGGTAIGTATLGSNGQAILITSTLAVGSHTITTTYAGDINFNGSNGSLNTNPQVVNQTGSTATTTTLISSQNPSNLSQSVTFTATVSGSGGTPTGSVTFTDTTTSQTLGTVTLTTIGGAQQAAFTMSALPAGTHHIQASYNGDANFAASYAAIDQTVNKANPVGSFNQSLATTVFSEPVTFTLTLSQAPPGGFTPTGTATFSDGGNLFASATLANIGGGQAQATFTTATLSIGSHTITASYGGDNNFNGTSITGVQKVIAANSNTTVSASLNPSSFGQTVTFTASVTPASPATATPTGTVTFSVNGGTGIPVMLSGGQATFTTSTLPAGNDTITATYGGDGNFNGSAGSIGQTVTGVTSTTTLVSSANPSTFGQSVTFTARVSGSGGTPTGSVTFTDQTPSQTLGTVNLVNVGGAQQAALTISSLTVGSHNIQASYGGDNTFGGSSATLNQLVGKTTSTTTLISSANPSTFGQPVTFTATVSGSGGTPTGTVTFTDTTTSQTLGTVTLVPGRDLHRDGQGRKRIWNADRHGYLQGWHDGSRDWQSQRRGNSNVHDICADTRQPFHHGGLWRRYQLRWQHIRSLD